MSLFSWITDLFEKKENDKGGKPPVVNTPLPLNKIKDKNNRILICAKNKYIIGQNLNGCLGDAGNYQDYFLKLGFDPSCFKILLDEQSTGQAEREGLIWLGNCTGPYAIYINSSHGIISEDGHEATACYDFSFDNDDGLIKSIHVREALKKLQKTTKVIICNDACHSDNDLLKDLAKGKPKAIVNPNGKKRILAKGKSLTENMLDCVYFGGCLAKQTSADTVINGKPCGAMSYYWLENAKVFGNPVAKTLGDKVVVDLKKNRYSQISTCEGSKKLEPLY